MVERRPCTDLSDISLMATISLVYRRQREREREREREGGRQRERERERGIRPHTQRLVLIHAWLVLSMCDSTGPLTGCKVIGPLLVGNTQITQKHYMPLGVTYMLCTELPATCTPS